MRVEIFLEGSTDAIPMDTHKQLRDAANTIWYLRCKLADMVDQRDEIERLKAENTELRRLVRTYRACHDHVDACRGCSELPDCEALEKMRSIGREVGIEVIENE
jgi:CRISPR/Cas system-associated protein Cas10 (large subunit of type III CRISPR-Cas system)